MSRKKELRKLSKGELIEGYIKLENRIEKVEHYLKAFDNAHTLSSKQLKSNTKTEDLEESESEDKSSDEEKKNRLVFLVNQKEVMAEALNYQSQIKLKIILSIFRQLVVCHLAIRLVIVLDQ